VEVVYPFWVDDPHCDHASLRLECRWDTPVLRLSSREYAVTGVSHGDKKVSLVDLATLKSKCPDLAGGNLTLPPP
jgi:hypothetical protein